LVKYSPEELIRFEDEIADLFNSSRIKAPVHLYAGNESEMIDVFNQQKIGEKDWVFCSWRSHYQCLLKGVPQEKLQQAILNGRSISLCFGEQRVFSSAIVTGQVPIAVGVAMSIKRDGGKERVFCFMGDMTAETGIVHECIKYSRNHKLPIHFIVEDNGKSVCTDTRKTWGTEKLSFEEYNDEYVTYYRYALDKYPHAGAGKRVQF
jgi:pyruvate dehydrogenase E1 component alpha subunit